MQQCLPKAEIVPVQDIEVDAAAERWEEFVNYWLRLQELNGNT